MSAFTKEMEEAYLLGSNPNSEVVYKIYK